MAFNLSGAITGAAVPGFTAPTFTPTADIAPTVNGKQWAIGALGGTQVGVEVNSVSKPFTISFFRPTTLKQLPQANPITGLIRTVPVNSYKLITRKGAMPAAGQVSAMARIYTIIEVPAGTDTQVPEDIKAMISAHLGAAFAQSSGIADTVLSGVM